MTLPDGIDVVVIVGGGSTVIFSDALLLGYVTEVAMTVTFVGVLTLLGAL